MTDEPPPEETEEMHISPDTPRLLARGLGYVDHHSRALRNEPEAVPEGDLELLAGRAHDRERQEHAEALQDRRARLLRERDYHAGRLRDFEKQLRRIDRKIS